MTSKQHTILAFLLISSLLSFFRIDIPPMTKAEESFSLHWGILSIFGTFPINSDSWGAFADQAPYLSLGETPFVNPPLPMWGMVAWSKLMGETLPSTRFLSCILAMCSLISLYFIGKNLGKSQYAMYASGSLAGSLIWNDTARHASPEIWGITFLLTSLALSFGILNLHETKLSRSFLTACLLLISSTALTLSSFTNIVIFSGIILLLLALYKPSKMHIAFLVSPIILGAIVGYTWFLNMDLPYASQIVDTLQQVRYIPTSSDIQTMLIDFSLLPFFLIGIFAGIQSIIKKEKNQAAFVLAISWFVLSYVGSGFTSAILPSFILIALQGVNSFDAVISSIKVKWIFISISFFMAAFGIAPRLLEGLLQFVVNQQFSMYGIIPILGIIGILITIFLKEEKLRTLVYNAMARIILALVIAAMIKVAFANLLGKTRITKDALVYSQNNVIQYYSIRETI
ncbi:MAG: ArnT family glycosyltransferase [Candidatus Kapaibacteriota bacterium]